MFYNMFTTYIDNFSFERNKGISSFQYLKFVFKLIVFYLER